MPLLDFPPDMFSLNPGEAPLYGEFPDLKAGVTWFVDHIGAENWHSRREAIAKHFYQSLVGEASDPTGKGKYYTDDDVFAWHLFQGEAFTDHPWNYEVIFGARVIPVLAAIGRNLPLLQGIDGFEARAMRIAGSERAQPNGGFFEILVAAAYARAGYQVSFMPEKKGVERMYDLLVEKGEKRYAVECKRMEAGDYVEGERMRMRELWGVASQGLAKELERSTYLEVRFNIELAKVPDDYLLNKVLDFIDSGLPSMLWNDEISSGVVGDLDLEPIQVSLKTGYLLHPGPVFNKLLTGSYRRYDNLLTTFVGKHAQNPHMIDELKLAVAARWSSLSPDAIEKKARDINRKLADANDQLPKDIPGVVHIGFEALSGDEVEQRRYEKIIARARAFDRKESGLEFIYCHYFAPESSPEETWAIDETLQWIGVRPGQRPLDEVMLILPGEPTGGVHWHGPPAEA